MPQLVEPVIDPRLLDGVAQPEIAAGELTLRTWSAADVPSLIRAYGDADIQQWHLRSLESESEAVALIDEWSDRWRYGIGASWAVVRSSDATVVGQVAFRALYLVDGLAEVSYWVLPRARRSGVATRATRALGDWAIDDLGLVRLELVHSVHNPPSCRVALQAGFLVEGTKRMLQRHLDGFHDMHLHSRIRGDKTP